VFGRFDFLGQKDFLFTREQGDLAHAPVIHVEQIRRDGGFVRMGHRQALIGNPVESQCVLGPGDEVLRKNLRFFQWFLFHGERTVFSFVVKDLFSLYFDHDELPSVECGAYYIINDAFGHIRRNTLSAIGIYTQGIKSPVASKKAFILFSFFSDRLLAVFLLATGD
jgi:hypothetical protein